MLKYYLIIVSLLFISFFVDNLYFFYPCCRYSLKLYPYSSSFLKLLFKAITLFKKLFIKEHGKLPLNRRVYRYSGPIPEYNAARLYNHLFRFSFRSDLFWLQNSFFRNPNITILKTKKFAK